MITNFEHDTVNKIVFYFKSDNKTFEYKLKHNLKLPIKNLDIRIYECTPEYKYHSDLIKESYDLSEVSEGNLVLVFKNISVIRQDLTFCIQIESKLKI